MPSEADRLAFAGEGAAEAEASVTVAEDAEFLGSMSLLLCAFAT